MTDFFHEALTEEYCPRVESSRGDDSPDFLKAFFEKADLKQSLRQSRATFSKVDRAAILAVDSDEEELRELVKRRGGCEPPAELAELAKRDSSLRKAAGCIAHACKKSLTVTEALQSTLDLFSDQCTSEELGLLQRAVKALDIAVYLEVLSQVFARPF